MFQQGFVVASVRDLLKKRGGWGYYKNIHCVHQVDPKQFLLIFFLDPMHCFCSFIFTVLFSRYTHFFTTSLWMGPMIANPFNLSWIAFDNFLLSGLLQKRLISPVYFFEPELQSEVVDWLAWSSLSIPTSGQRGVRIETGSCCKKHTTWGRRGYVPISFQKSTWVERHPKHYQPQSVGNLDH